MLLRLLPHVPTTIVHGSHSLFFYYILRKEFNYKWTESLFFRSKTSKTTKSINSERKESNLVQTLPNWSSFCTFTNIFHRPYLNLKFNLLSQELFLMSHMLPQFECWHTNCFFIANESQQHSCFRPRFHVTYNVSVQVFCTAFMFALSRKSCSAATSLFKCIHLEVSSLQATTSC